VVFLLVALVIGWSLDKRRFSLSYITRMALTLGFWQKERKFIAATIRILSRSRRFIESGGW